MQRATLIDLEAFCRHMADFARRHGEGQTAEVCKAAAERLAEERARMQLQASQRAPEWITTTEAAERFGMSRDAVEKLCSRKGMGRKTGGRWLADATAIRFYLKKR
jgi:hypothetical protein